MIALLPLLFAQLTWNVIPGAVFVGLPSDVIVEQVCVEDVCLTPQSPQLAVVPWDREELPTVVRARLKGGGMLVAYQLPNFTG